MKNPDTTLTTETAGPGGPTQTADSTIPRSVSEIKLQSLAPEYKEEQHAAYVRHLDAAVTEPKNKNIALTGRYGSGKSSILDNFLEGQEKEKKTLRISINTLGPDDGEDITNRIQKELVKQLVFRVAPGAIRHSRFARRKELTRRWALVEATGVGLLIVGLLWLFGIRPDISVSGADHLVWAMSFLFVLTVGSAWAIRWAVGNRLVSQFSTGGTAIQFDKPPDSFFDEYLDEIVAFFDATTPDLVVFEDLDRFDDPRIFDSLRELNTLINASAHWQRREQPLRFVYAIKDSLFEKLGEGSHGDDSRRKPATRTTQDATPDEQANSTPQKIESKQRDAAEMAVERANRTKFFEVVIPVVPFLSHSNARDLLATALRDLELPSGTEITRGLLDLVARHATDMRLLINICNEFVVFAQKLLWIDGKGRTPGLTANDLFALVVYKNFHMADFEKLPHRGSALDTLELKRRDLVRDSIAKLQKDKQEVIRLGRLLRERQETARALGDRLLKMADAMGQTIISLSVEEETYEPDAVHTPEFWKGVSETGKVQLQFRHKTTRQPSTPPPIKRDQLNDLFPDAMEIHQRVESDKEIAAKCAEFDRRVAAFRGADFAALVKEPFVEGVEGSFADEVNGLLSSRLARDLVLSGYLNRYYAEYSAVFYGDFLGVDVANFFRNSVWPNEMDVQFQFTTTDAASNVLEQAPVGFTSSRSALNIQVIDYMLAHRQEKAKEVVTFLVTGQSTDRLEFLDAFLNEPSAGQKDLVGLLAAHPWRGLFDHLACPDSVPDEDTRTALVDAALLSSRDADSYELDEEARELIIDRHPDLMAFTEDQGEAMTDVVFSFVRRVGLIAPSLRPLSLSERLLRRFVENRVYALTADNLRAALGLRDNEAITLDRILRDEVVWQRCREDVDTYLDAVDDDEHTDHAVLTANIVSNVVSQQHEQWSDEQLARVLASSAPEAALPDLTKVPQNVWPAIAEARQVVPNATNLYAYAETFGVDEHLARVLLLEEGVAVEIEALEHVEPEVIHALTVWILNASKVIGAKDRVRLALRFNPEPQSGSFETTELKPSGDDLLVHLLDAELVPDTAATFQHFLTAGWHSVSAAFKVSASAQSLVTPELVAGHILDLLRDQHVPDSVKTMVVSDLGAYSADEDEEVLSAAASFAHEKGIQMSLLQVEWSAPHVTDPEHTLWQLAGMGGDLEGDDAIRVLSLLGGDYQNFNGDSGHEFDVPVTESIKAVLDRLRAHGLVKLPRGGKNGRKKVELR